MTLFVSVAIDTLTERVLPSVDETAEGAASALAAVVVGAGIDAVTETATVVTLTAVVVAAGTADVVVPDSVCVGDDVDVELSTLDWVGVLVSDAGGDDEADVNGASVDVVTDDVVKVSAELCLTTVGQPTDQHATSRK